ncbi:MAG TPA: HlyD family efflux transporter periplasmic adaptor subunit [Rhodanobacteraceae bacterium]
MTGEVAITVLALLLGACASGVGGTPASSAEPAAKWLAVARGQVDVEGGMVEVAARASGVVAAVAVTQSEHVTKGEVLARLDPRAAKIHEQTAQAELAQAKAKVQELAVSLAPAQVQAGHLAAAAKAGIATRSAAAQAATTVATLKAKQAAAQAGLEVAQQQLAGAKLELDGMTLRAPVAGTVVTRHVAVGQAVAAGAGPALFTLLPDLPYVVRAQVNELTADHLRPGMHAEVVRDSGAGPVYAATLVRVGTVLQAATLSPSPLARALVNDVDCTLKLVPAKPGVAPIRIGQQVIVRFPHQ